MTDSDQIGIEDLLDLIQDAVAISDKWFGTYGDSVKATECINRARLVLQVSGWQPVFDPEFEAQVKAFADKGLRLDGKTPLADDDWVPEGVE